MKKNLLVFTCFVLVFSACKKDTSKPINIITATVGSTNVNFSTAATGQVKSMSSTSVYYSLQFIGSTGNESYAQKLSLTINSKIPIAKGTYSMSATDTTSSTLLTYVENALTNNSLVFSGISGTVIITSISNNNVQGTFSGTVLSQQGGFSVQTISNGKFSLAL